MTVDVAIIQRSALVVICLFNIVTPSNSIPKRGNEPWSVILCKFADIDFEPKPKLWFDQWIGGRNQTDSIGRYFADVSNNVYTIFGSTVHGWLSLPYTLQQVRQLAENDRQLQADENERFFALYDKTKQVCIEAALNSGERLQQRKITVVNAEVHSAVYGRKYGILVSPELIFSSAVTHEMVHSFFIGHSYSDRNVKIFPHALVGEYDDVYDLMSTEHAFMHPSPFGFSGPGLNGPHLDYLGWLPMHRIVYFGRDGRNNYTLRLSSISVPHSTTRGWLLILIPYDRDDPGNVFTVEFRTNKSQDSGIQKNAVVIHQVKRVGTRYYSMVVTRSWNHYELVTGNDWINILNFGSPSTFQYIKVQVERISPNEQYADVRITSTFDPDLCKSHEVDVMMSVNSDNRTNQTTEHICAPRLVNYNKETLLKLQLRRQRFFKERYTFGMNECSPGTVWRAIDPYDYVCVKPSRIRAILQDSELDSQRKQNGTCLDPFVMRGAFEKDGVCVSSQERITIQEENKESSENLRHYSFFNGDDTVEE